MIKIGLIPAAGAGVRAYPATNYMPKVMLEIAGKPLILRNVELMRDKMDIREIYIIVGYMGDVIKSFLGDGSSFGVNITYIDCPQHSIGLARGILLAKERIRGNFVTILGDELYVNSNHEKLQDYLGGNFSAVCGLMQVNDLSLIAKNYTVETRDGVITDLIEKPRQIINRILGCGTYIFTPEIFQAIEEANLSPRSGKIELTDVINNLAKKTGAVRPFFLEGVYCNINSVEDYNYANFTFRSLFFNEYKISVIIPAYNEGDSIGAVVKDFAGRADEIFVVDNSSADNTKEIAEKAGARVEVVKLKGYGDTIRYGLDNAKGDILFVVEADHSFRSKDIGKFLEYLKDSDMVIGTRTTRQLIEQGANMQGLLRWGNVFAGKLVEALWWKQEPRFTDVGCTYRAIWKDAYWKIRDNLKGTGPEFAPEMMIELLRARKRIIEIPVSYYKRFAGTSRHSRNYFGILKTAIRMFKLILARRFNLK